MNIISLGGLVGWEVGVYYVVFMKRVDDIGLVVGRGVGRDWFMLG